MRPKASIKCSNLLMVWILVATIAVSAVFSQGDDFPNEITPITSGSCLTSGLCCPGRDSSCVVQKAPSNAIIEDLTDIPCYCDHGCVLLNDCCSDFKSACGVQDCEVSNWGTWSSCNAECGLGSMIRRRTILKEPRNGGKDCPSIVQKRGCRGTRCFNHHHLRNSAYDTAFLLPVEFAQKRKVNETYDITRNLRLRYPKNPAKEKAKPYCVEFEVIRSTMACKSLEGLTSLREGNRVCVKCELEAQRATLNFKCSGTGSERGVAAARFSSLREPACHGNWRHLSSNIDCSCLNGSLDTNLPLKSVFLRCRLFRNFVIGEAGECSPESCILEKMHENDPCLPLDDTQSHFCGRNRTTCLGMHRGHRACIDTSTKQIKGTYTGVRTPLYFVQ